MLPEPTPENPEPPATKIIPARSEVAVKIVAALINPIGNDIGKETVILKNTTDQTIDLTGWVLIDKQHRIERLDGITIETGEEKTILLEGLGIYLSNHGGIISLLNPEKIKIHGVAYVRKQAYKQGILVHFTQ